LGGIGANGKHTKMSTLLIGASDGITSELMVIEVEEH